MNTVDREMFNILLENMPDPESGQSMRWLQEKFGISREELIVKYWEHYGDCSFYTKEIALAHIIQDGYTARINGPLYRQDEEDILWGEAMGTAFTLNSNLPNSGVEWANDMPVFTLPGYVFDAWTRYYAGDSNSQGILAPWYGNNQTFDEWGFVKDLFDELKRRGKRAVALQYYPEHEATHPQDVMGIEVPHWLEVNKWL